MNYKYNLLMILTSVKLSAMNRNTVSIELHNNLHQAPMQYANQHVPAREASQSVEKDYSVHTEIAELIVEAYDKKLVDYNMEENQHLVKKFIDDPKKNYSDFMELLKVYYFATFDQNGEEETYFGSILDMAEKNQDDFIDAKAIISSCKILSKSPISSKGRHTPGKGKHIPGMGKKGSRVVAGTIQRSGDVRALRMFLRSAIIESEDCRRHKQNVLFELKEIRDTEMLDYSFRTSFTREDLKKCIEDVEENYHYQYISEGLYCLIDDAFDINESLDKARAMVSEENRQFTAEKMRKENEEKERLERKRLKREGDNYLRIQITDSILFANKIAKLPNDKYSMKVKKQCFMKFMRCKHNEPFGSERLWSVFVKFMANPSQYYSEFASNRSTFIEYEDYCRDNACCIEFESECCIS